MSSDHPQMELTAERHVIGLADKTNRDRLPMSTFERSFAAAERNLGDAAKQVEVLRKNIREADVATRSGDLRTLAKSAQAAQSMLESLRANLSELLSLLNHDFAADMRSGAYAEEIAAAAIRANLKGVRVVQGAIFSFPLVLRPLADKLALQLGKQRSAAIRPSVVVQTLAKKRAYQMPRNVAQRLVDSVERAFLLATGGQVNRGVPIRDIYQYLTLLPGVAAEYTELDFVADLYAIERAAVMESTSHRKLSLPASTSTTGRNVIRITTEEGEERLYSSIRFD
jgi:hypothetical protein